MDARQNFYNHNRLLFRFLVGATLVFVGVIALLWWQEKHQPIHEEQSLETLRHFSTEAAMAEVTRNYVYDARYIHDMESYAELSSVFFTPVLRAQLGGDTLSSRLAEVITARAGDTDFGKTYVYHTSYYIGNLLVLPNLTLHELLLKQPLPETALLLETALADLRAGAVKIQQYYDVAPPGWYLGATTSTLFYPTPSFPSLTVSEATLMFYLLANLDPGNARFYKQQAEQFASFVFASGANFKIDIEYAIRLAAAYYDVMQSMPEYQALLAKASDEWANIALSSEGSKLEQDSYNFLFPNFPIPSQFNVVTVKAKTYTEPVDEELRGSLRLTLVDTRLPEPNYKLYEYDLAGRSGLVLPFALDLTARQFPGLMSSVGFAQYLDTGNYLFLSGKAATDYRGGYDLSSTSIYWRNSKVTPVALDPVPQASYGVSEVVLRNSGEEFLFVPIRYASNLPIIMRAELDSSYTAKVTEAARGSSADYIGENAIAYLRDGTVYYSDLGTGTESTLEGLSTVTRSTGRFSDLDYYPEQKMLVLTSNSYSPSTGLREGAISTYSIAENGGELNATENIVITLPDAHVDSTKFSPGGRYLAIALKKGSAEYEPALLLYDIKSGIIKKEIDISSFAPNPVHIDGWTLF